MGHVHHGLQAEADAWLAFTEAAALQLGASFLSRRLPRLPARPEGGLEAWARRLRYQALADMAAAAGATLVVTAHHANDQLETHRLRRLRGAGSLGLGAMRAAAPLPGAPQHLLLRPLLGVERSRILDYARTHRLDWVEDPSNQDLRYARELGYRIKLLAVARKHFAAGRPVLARRVGATLFDRARGLETLVALQK